MAELAAFSFSLIGVSWNRDSSFVLKINANKINIEKANTNAQNNLNLQININRKFNVTFKGLGFRKV